MNKTLVLVASALLAALWQLSPLAQWPETRASLFLVAVRAIIISMKTPTACPGELGYFLTDKWQAGIRQSVNGIDTDGKGVDGNGSGNRWAGSTRGYIDYNFLDGTYRPYIGANLGGIYGEEVSNTGSAGLKPA